MTIEERLETLEKELNRVNRRNRRLMGCLAVALVVVAAAWILKPHVLLAQDATSKPCELKVIRWVRRALTRFGENERKSRLFFAPRVSRRDSARFVATTSSLMTSPLPVSSTESSSKPRHVPQIG